MTGSIVGETAASLGPLWQDYWRTRWHRPLPWEKERLACFLTADEGRAGPPGRRFVADFPSGRRPFLGVITNSGDGSPAAASGVVEFNDDGHLLTIAPTRSGKGATQIVPNLLLYAGSCLVIDIKGENHAITAAHREALFAGAKVLKFAPFDEGGQRYNPLDFIRVNPDGSPNSFTYDDTRLLAQMLIPGSAEDKFWDIEARALLSLLIFFVACAHRPGDSKRTMRSVVGKLFPGVNADDGGAFLDVISDIAKEAALTDNTVLGQMVGAFMEHDAKLSANILSSCRSAMHVWLSERLQKATEVSDFQFSDLKRSMCRPADQSPAPTTLYLIIPPEHLREYRPILRMLVGLAAVEMTRPSAWAEDVDNGWAPQPPCPVLFLLDEFPSLGHMAPIEQGVAYLAGYGVQLWTFAQSIGQLKDIYKENWTTFVSNAGAASYFGVTDSDLAELLSKQLGETEEYATSYETGSTSYGTSWNHSSGSSFGDSYSSNSSSSSGSSEQTTTQDNVRFKRELVARPAEIRSLPPELALVFLRGRRPALVGLVPYFQSDLFGELYGVWNR
jgi:type IV secretory pathway TraG/TraD family ATPase VirD4